MDAVVNGVFFVWVILGLVLSYAVIMLAIWLYYRRHKKDDSNNTSL
jgi:hypothetical protein